ncbi:hypothetical protein C4D60_Mb00t16890 [Musa balbisiana]|uniref:Uncharacterized protein n=1 Tax=Musa balbisiana TaxID=52838 RepID=A0A4S8I2N8_MUSBA|nr:hypothetical protein C4D60_Mb00t16890 [Musa balbisiana]
MFDDTRGEGSYVNQQTIAQIPVSEGYLGRVISSAKPIDGGLKFQLLDSRLIASPAPGIISSVSVLTSSNGAFAIDSMIPIDAVTRINYWGQQTVKTPYYGQKASSVAQVVTTFRKRGRWNNYCGTETADSPATFIPLSL